MASLILVSGGLLSALPHLSEGLREIMLPRKCCLPIMQKDEGQNDGAEEARGREQAPAGLSGTAIWLPLSSQSIRFLMSLLADSCMYVEDSQGLLLPRLALWPLAPQESYPGK